MDETQVQPDGGSTQKQKPNQTKWIIIAIIAILVLFMGRMILSPESITERIIERSTDGTYDVEMNKDGSMEITGGDGDDRINVSTGGSAKIPDEWPDSIPLMSDAEIAFSGTSASGEGMMGITLNYISSQSVETITEFYRTAFSDNGWKIEATIDIGNGTMLSAVNGDEHRAVVNIAGDEGVTNVMLNAEISE